MQLWHQSSRLPSLERIPYKFIHSAKLKKTNEKYEQDPKPSKTHR